MTKTKTKATYDGPAKPKPPKHGAVAIRIARQPKGGR